MIKTLYFLSSSTTHRTHGSTACSATLGVPATTKTRTLLWNALSGGMPDLRNSEGLLLTEAEKLPSKEVQRVERSQVPRPQISGGWVF
jgi:hypothetical protein